MAVGPINHYADGNFMSLGEYAAFHPTLAAIGRIGAVLSPPNGADAASLASTQRRSGTHGRPTPKRWMRIGEREPRLQDRPQFI